MPKWIKRLARNEQGATAIEYGLILALMFLAILAAVQAFTGSFVSIFNTATDALVAAVS